MNLDFTAEDVRQHLQSLGYKSITDPQLKDFVGDLRRLIRYEEKQNRLQTLINADLQPDSSKQGADQVSITRQRKVQDIRQERTTTTKVKKAAVITKQRRSLHWSPTGDITLSNESVSLSYQSSLEAATSSASNSQVVEDEIRVRINKAPPFEIPVGKDKPRQILPPRPELPTQPTCSFIRPVIKEPVKKSLKHDPVKLHQFYKEHWNKQRLPGEMNRREKDLRWATREWMNMEPK